MEYRLIALDLDGTILPRGQPISPRVVQAIRAAVTLGIQVVLASGRMFRVLAPYAEQLGIDGPLICYGGALIRRALNGGVLYEQRLPQELACEVVQVGRELGLPIHAYVDDELYVEGLTPAHPMYARLRREYTHAVDDLDHFLRRNGPPPHHMALVTARDREVLVRRLKERFGTRLNVTTGHPNLAEIDHPNVSKGTALRWLAEQLGIPREQVLAVGDDHNDLTMITYAGLGVAMGHAPAAVRAMAQVIVPSLDGDGIARVLEEYVLGR